MTPEFDEVLLTAYLDDEVTDVERAAVEQQLQNSESARKLLEELKSIRNMVTQLHLSQPIRNLQKGAWSTTSETRQVALQTSESSKYWRQTVQRLASIAAMIAIVACTTVLLMEPNRKDISRVDSTGLQPTEEPLAKSMEKVPFDDAGLNLDRRSEGVPSYQFEFDVNSSLERSIKPETELSLGREKRDVDSIPEDARGIFEAKTKSQDASRSAQLVPAPRGGAAPGGPQGSSRTPSNTLQFQETEGLSRAENRSLNSPSLALRELAEKPIEPQTDMSLSHFFESYFHDDQKQKPSTLRIDDFMLNDALAREEKKEIAEAVETNETIFCFSWNVQASDRTENQAEDLKERNDGLPESGAADQSLANFSKEDFIRDQRSLMKKKSGVPNSLLIEFQIPSDEWSAGAKRLRQLGIDVPLELPDVDVLEFIAKRNEDAPPALTSAPVEDVPAKVLSSNDKDASNTAASPSNEGETISYGRRFMLFRQTAPSRTTGRSTELDSKSQKSQLSKEDVPSKFSIRIRVNKQP